MKGFLQIGVGLAFILATAADSVSRYEVSPPAGVIVVDTRQQLNEVSSSVPDGYLDDENGGYYLKTSAGDVVAVAGDTLCAELDGAFKQIDALEDVSDDLDTTKRTDCGSVCGGGNMCNFPRCQTVGSTAICLLYSHCYICTNRKVCI
jgi:hypothetical protein